LIKHQEQYIGTERVYSKDFKSLKSFSFAGRDFPVLDDMLEKIHEREPKRAYIARQYFEKMGKSFREMNRVSETTWQNDFCCRRKHDTRRSYPNFQIPRRNRYSIRISNESAVLLPNQEP